MYRAEGDSTQSSPVPEHHPLNHHWRLKATIVHNDRLTCTVDTVPAVQSQHTAHSLGKICVALQFSFLQNHAGPLASRIVWNDQAVFPESFGLWRGRDKVVQGTGPNLHLIYCPTPNPRPYVLLTPHELLPLEGRAAESSVVLPNTWTRC